MKSPFSELNSSELVMICEYKCWIFRCSLHYITIDGRWLLGDNDKDLNAVKRALISPFGFYQPALGQDKILISCLGIGFFKGLDLSFLLVILFYWKEDRVGREAKPETETRGGRLFIARVFKLHFTKGPLCSYKILEKHFCFVFLL